jgi:hypothetical protein
VTPFLGRDADPYTNLNAQDADPDAFTGGASTDSTAILLGFSIGMNAVSPATDLAPQGSIYVGIVTIDGVDYHQYQDTSRWDPSLPSDGPALYLFPVNDDTVWTVDPPAAPAPPPGAPPPTQQAPQASPPPSAPAPDPPPVQTLSETIITGTIPFSPDVSYPPALEAAKRRGHIEGGDVKQFFKGGYNGLVNTLPLLLGPVLGQAAKAIPRVEIDPRYGGAAIVGEQLAENLSLEAAAAIPALGRAAGGALHAEAAVVETAPVLEEAAQAGKRVTAELPALAPEIGVSLPPELPSTEAAELFRARDEAAVTARKIVEQEMREGSWKWAPDKLQARYGTWLDALTKANIRQAVAEGRLPGTFVTSPTVTLSRGYLRPWIKAPDVWDTATGRAWDMMPAREASFYAHETSYLGTTATGRLDPGGTVITEIFPLFHFGF